MSLLRLRLFLSGGSNAANHPPAQEIELESHTDAGRVHWLVMVERPLAAARARPAQHQGSMRKECDASTARIPFKERHTQRREGGPQLTWSL